MEDKGEFGKGVNLFTEVRVSIRKGIIILEKNLMWFKILKTNRFKKPKKFRL